MKWHAPLDFFPYIEIILPRNSLSASSTVQSVYHLVRGKQALSYLYDTMRIKLARPELIHVNIWRPVSGLGDMTVVAANKPTICFRFILITITL